MYKIRAFVIDGDVGGSPTSLSTSATTITNGLRNRGASLQNNMQTPSQTPLWTHNSKNLGNMKKKKGQRALVFGEDKLCLQISLGTHLTPNTQCYRTYWKLVRPDIKGKHAHRRVKWECYLMQLTIRRTFPSLPPKSKNNYTNNDKDAHRCCSGDDCGIHTTRLRLWARLRA